MTILSNPENLFAQEKGSSELVLKELVRQAMGGEAKAQLQLGLMYARGDGVEKHSYEQWHRISLLM